MACDADLLQGYGLRLDESLLTGESVPVDKLPDRGGDPGVRTALGRINAGHANGNGNRMGDDVQGLPGGDGGVGGSRWHARGLLAFEDPLRDDVPAALAACRSAGVRVVMITGDAPSTALAIAGQAGLLPPEVSVLVESDVLTGAGIDAMNDAEAELAARRVSVFARVTPAQKLRLVQALQRRGEVVAMTGDGVNDGPALRAAEVGVDMGARGADVAREAASLVLMDDRFAALVEAVRAGRRIFANLQHALGYLFAVHVPIVGMSLLPLFGGPVLLLPLHVVLLELIIDPACSEGASTCSAANTFPLSSGLLRWIGCQTAVKTRTFYRRSGATIHCQCEAAMRAASEVVYPFGDG